MAAGVDSIVYNMKIIENNEVIRRFFFLTISTCIVSSVRGRLVLESDDVSSIDAVLCGDNDAEDTVRLAPFLFDCSADGDDELDE